MKKEEEEKEEKKPTRRSKRKAPPVDPDSTDTEEDEDDNDEKTESEEETYEEVSEKKSKAKPDLTCPHCNKQFANARGLEYHIGTPQIYQVLMREICHLLTDSYCLFAYFGTQITRCVRQ